MAANRVENAGPVSRCVSDQSLLRGCRTQHARIRSAPGTTGREREIDAQSSRHTTEPHAERSSMKHVSSVFTASILALGSVARAAPSTPKQRVFEMKPFGMKLAIRMIPVRGFGRRPDHLSLPAPGRRGHVSGRSERHRRASAGNTLGSRNRGEFVGEQDETILFTLPTGSQIAS